MRHLRRGQSSTPRPRHRVLSVAAAHGCVPARYVLPLRLHSHVSRPPGQAGAGRRGPDADPSADPPQKQQQTGSLAALYSPGNLTAHSTFSDCLAVWGILADLCLSNGAAIVRCPASRKALRAGELEARRKELLDAREAGMVWEPGEEAWETKLAALRSYRRVTGHLAPRQDTVWHQGAGGAEEEGEAMVPVGQHMANLRRKGGLGKNPQRAKARADQLTAIDPDWNCPWPLDWQRHYRVLAGLTADEPGGVLPTIEPGVVFDGDDLGRWLQRQRRAWAALSAQQRERLAGLGMTPVERPAAAPVAGSGGKVAGGLSAAFQRGVQALTQWTEREGTHTAVPRGHIETVVTNGQKYEYKLGIWYANQKQRRHTLTKSQRAALAEVGIDWV